MKKTLALTLLLNVLPFLAPGAEAAEPLSGSETAPVQVILYGDVQCPFTAKLMTYLDRFEADFGSRIGIQFSQFPLAFHEQAKPAAIASLCAARQGELRAFLKQAFSHQDKLGRELFLATAREIPVRDLTAFTECLDAPETAAAVDAEYAAGEKAGVNSTPNLLIGGELVRGVYPYEELKTKIDKALEKREAAHR